MIYSFKSFFFSHRAGKIARACTLLCAFFNFTLAFAQENFKPKLGTVDKATVEMNAFPKDSTADAVVLYDYADVNFKYEDHVGIVIVSTYWTRIKILKESALDRASVTLRYGDEGVHDKRETIYDINGYTYNLNGKEVEKTSLSKKSIVKERISDKYYAVKFNLPNVKKGSVIEYSYTKTTPFKYQDKPSTWRFQAEIPVNWSEFNINIPIVLYYKVNMSGYLPLHVSDRSHVMANVGHEKLNGNGLAYRFVVKDAPAFSGESFITTPSDYLSKVSFELSSINIMGEKTQNFSQEWKDVDKTFMEIDGFGGQLKKFGFIRQIRDEIAAKATTPEEKMAMAYAYIQKTMKWDENGGLATREGIQKAFANKKGSAVEINLMLTNLLRELGLDSNPVVLSTRSNGRVNEAYALLESFNYVISHVKIGEKEYFLDATQRNAAPGLLPEHALAGIGRLVPAKDEGRFLNLTPGTALSRFDRIDADISPENGLVKGNYTMSLTGYEALRWRDKYVSETESGYGDILKKQFPEWTIGAVKVENRQEKLSEAVNISSAFEIESDESASDIFYFNPMLVDKVSENPFKAAQRIYPINFVAGTTTSFVGNYKIPEGYYLDEVPKGEVLNLPEKAGKFAYMVKQNGNTISIQSLVMLYKADFTVEEYEVLREFYDRIVKRHAQPLVIKKKK